MLCDKDRLSINVELIDSSEIIFAVVNESNCLIESVELGMRLKDVRKNVEHLIRIKEHKKEKHPLGCIGVINDEQIVLHSGSSAYDG